MKFQVHFKDPDALSEALEAVRDEIRSSMEVLDSEEAEAIARLRSERMHEFASKWLKYGEYVTLEFDTGAGTCVVVRK